MIEKENIGLVAVRTCLFVSKSTDSVTLPHSCLIVCGQGWLFRVKLRVLVTSWLKNKLDLFSPAIIWYFFHFYFKLVWRTKVTIGFSSTTLMLRSFCLGEKTNKQKKSNLFFFFFLLGCRHYLSSQQPWTPVGVGVQVGGYWSRSDPLSLVGVCPVCLPAGVFLALVPSARGRGLLRRRLWRWARVSGYR